MTISSHVKLKRATLNCTPLSKACIYNDALPWKIKELTCVVWYQLIRREWITCPVFTRVWGSYRLKTLIHVLLVVAVYLGCPLLFLS